MSKQLPHIDSSLHGSPNQDFHTNKEIVFHKNSNSQHNNLNYHHTSTSDLSIDAIRLYNFSKSYMQHEDNKKFQIKKLSIIKLYSSVEYNFDVEFVLICG